MISEKHFVCSEKLFREAATKDWSGEYIEQKESRFAYPLCAESDMWSQGSHHLKPRGVGVERGDGVGPHLNGGEGEVVCVLCAG